MRILIIISSLIASIIASIYGGAILFNKGIKEFEEAALNKIFPKVMTNCPTTKNSK